MGVSYGSACSAQGVSVDFVALPQHSQLLHRIQLSSVGYEISPSGFGTLREDVACTENEAEEAEVF